jgi:hypothetical protein
MQRLVLVLLVGIWVGAGMAAGALAEEVRTAAAASMAEGSKEIIVQIFGRRCEYRREEVEEVLRRQDAVEAVTFLNNHGTVLVRYQPGTAMPVQFADAIKQVLPIGLGCNARVE